MQNQPNELPVSPALKKAWLDLHEAAPKGILNSKKMTRRQRERLTTAGYLEPIMRGWYRLKSPGAQTSSPAPTLEFLPVYLENRLGSRWCLSAESSLVIRMAPLKEPGRLVVMAETGSTTVHTFESGLRLTIYQDDQQLPTRMETLAGFRIMPMDTILGRMTNSQWMRQLHLVDEALRTTNNFETMVWQWLSEERYQATSRLGIRLGELGLTAEHAMVRKCLIEEGLAIPAINDQAVETLEVALETKLTPQPLENPHDLKTIWNLWSVMLQSRVTPEPEAKVNLLNRLSAIEHCLGSDTQNHLALSGYTVPREAVMSILAAPELAAEASGWPLLDPEERLTQPGQATPLAGDIDPQALVSMQGYLEALRLVKRSIVRMMEGQDLDRILRQDVRGWRMALMSPCAEAGLITRRQVLRYREIEENEVAIRTRMETWIELVSQCEPGFHRGLLAFLGILHIKPWVTGNQRMALLVLNGLNAAAGNSWTVINHSLENSFKNGITNALVNGDPLPLAELFSAHHI